MAGMRRNSRYLLPAAARHWLMLEIWKKCGVVIWLWFQGLARKSRSSRANASQDDNLVSSLKFWWNAPAISVY